MELRNRDTSREYRSIIGDSITGCRTEDSTRLHSSHLIGQECTGHESRQNVTILLAQPGTTSAFPPIRPRYPAARPARAAGEPSVLLAVGRRRAGLKLGRHRTGAQCRDADAARRELGVQGLAERQHERLASVIDRHVRPGRNAATDATLRMPPRCRAKLSTKANERSTKVRTLRSTMASCSSRLSFADAPTGRSPRC